MQGEPPLPHNIDQSRRLYTVQHDVTRGPRTPWTRPVCGESVAPSAMLTVVLLAIRCLPAAAPCVIPTLCRPMTYLQSCVPWQATRLLRFTHTRTQRRQLGARPCARVQEMYSYVCPDIAKEFAKYDKEPSKWIQKFNGVQAPPSLSQHTRKHTRTQPHFLSRAAFLFLSVPSVLPLRPGGAART